ncbi:mycofactocin biosynthesis peptidyl-dipeptidase MftE [Citricoccus zhacaiensis]
MRLTDATWPDINPQTFGGAAPVLVLPIGALEQHGPHLPLDTDAVTATAVAAALADARPRAALAPTLPIGASGEHAGFPGTLSIGSDALRQLVVEVVRSSTPAFSAVMVVNGHGGNVDALRSAADLCTAEGRTLLLHHLGLPGMDAHAGRTETSLMLHLTPERVRLEHAEPGNTTPVRELFAEMKAHGVRGVSPNGVLGDPTGASAAEGADLFVRLRDRATAAFDGLTG